MEILNPIVICSIEFEEGSKLEEIEELALIGTDKLKFIKIPKSSVRISESKLDSKVKIIYDGDLKLNDNDYTLFSYNDDSNN